MKHDTSSSPFLLRPVLGLWPALLAFALPALADDAAFEARLQALETQLKSVQAENKQLRQELGLDGKSGLTAIKPAGKVPVLTINGLLQTQAEFGDRGDTRGNANDRFRLRRMRIGAAGRFLEEFDFKIEGEYAGTSVSLTDGFINWGHFRWANVKAGQFKTPFGYEFLAPEPKLFTIERTLGSDRLTLNRQIGVQASGDFFEKRLTYATGVFNGSGANVATNDNENFNYMGRVAGTPWQGKFAGQPARWTVGADGFTTKDTALTLAGDFGFTGNTFTGKRDGRGVDTQFALGPFELWAEYLRVNFKPVSGVPAKAFAADSWYVQATYFVVPKSVQALVKFDTFDPNNLKSANETDTWTFGVNWLLKGEDLKLQLNYLVAEVPVLPTQHQLLFRFQTLF